MYISVTLFLLFLSGCGGGEGSSFDSSGDATLIQKYEDTLSSEYTTWVANGRPAQEDIPLPYLPRRTNAPASGLQVVSFSSPILQAASLAPVTYPNKFDLRDPNNDGNIVDSLISSVKDQGDCAVCWAFAGLAALEGSYSVQNIFDFSEDNLKHRHGFTIDPGNACAGGTITMTGTYLSRNDGAINETEDPYDESAGSEYCVDCKPLKYVDNIYWFNGRSDDSVTSQVNIDLVKALLVDNLKPIQVRLEVPSGTAGEIGTSLFDLNTSSFYQSGVAKPNHEVIIVGYDDDKVVQGQQGVFIVKNSWGNAVVTEQGYNYVPYSDKSIASGLVAVYQDLSEDEFSFDNIYAHDEFGIIKYGYSSDATSMFGANIYTTKGEEELVGINIMNWDQGTTYKLEIHRVEGDAIPTWDDNTTRLGDSIELSNGFYMGYHTIPLTQAITLPTNEKFAVLVQYIPPQGFKPLIPIESSLDGIAANQTANAGESYMSVTGAPGVENHGWTDIGQRDGYNLFIKAMTKNIQPTLIPPTLVVSIGSTSPIQDKSVGFTAVAADSDGNISSYSWDFGDGITSTQINPSHTFNTPGLHTVSCTVTDNDGLTAVENLIVDVIPLPIVSAKIAIKVGGGSDSHPVMSTNYIAWVEHDPVDPLTFSSINLYTISTQNIVAFSKAYLNPGLGVSSTHLFYSLDYNSATAPNGVASKISAYGINDGLTTILDDVDYNINGIFYSDSNFISSSASSNEIFKYGQFDGTQILDLRETPTYGHYTVGNNQLIALNVFGEALHIYEAYTENSIVSIPGSIENQIVYEDKIAFEAVVNGNRNIYLYINSSQTIEQITYYSGDDVSRFKLGRQPMYGNKVVWSDNHTGNDEIYMYNLDLKHVFALSSDGINKLFPAIYGNRVVWQEENGTDNDIYMMDVN